MKVAPTITRPPDILKESAWVIVNSSGGKDSQTALRAVVAECDRVGYPREQIVVSHQLLKREEWPGVTDLVYKQAAHYGLRVETSQYRDKDGVEKSLLDYVRARKKWPDSKNRFCTSDFKRGPGNRVIVRLCRERSGSVVQIFGFRAEESPARRKKETTAKNPRASTKSRLVMDWLPIHHWTEEQVWADIRESGVPYHPAYDLGMPRLSCALCIFAPEPALMIAGKANPELLDEYCEIETEINHTFRKNFTINSVRDKILAGIEPGKVDGAWNM